MLAELTEKLRTKFQYSENHIQAVAADIREYAERVEISGELKVARADPDDKFIECAITGNEEFIIIKRSSRAGYWQIPKRQNSYSR